MEREGLNSTIIVSSAHHGVTEGARRATGVTPSGALTEVPRIMSSDPEVPEKKPRRKFTAKYKLEILDKAPYEVYATLLDGGNIIVQSEPCTESSNPFTAMSKSVEKGINGAIIKNPNCWPPVPTKCGPGISLSLKAP